MSPEIIRLAGPDIELVFLVQRHPLRRKLAVRVQEDGRFLLLCPQLFPAARLKKELAGRIPWFLSLQTQYRAIPGTVHMLTDGASLPWLGQSLILTLKSDSSRPAIRRDDARLLAFGYAPEALSSALQSWYRHQAREILTKRLRIWESRMGRQANKIQIRNQKSRWGSCSTSGTIALNFRLVMLAWELIDYVLVHELAHLHEMNHSTRFWNQVAVQIPDWRNRRKTLMGLPPLPF